MKFTKTIKLKTWLMSSLAILLFLIPVYFNGQWTIVLGILADGILFYFNDYIQYIVAFTAVISLLLTTYYSFFNSENLKQHKELHDIFVVNLIWYFLRLIGTLFALLIVFQVGPEFIISNDTGGTMMNDLVPILGTWLLLAAFLMPLLMNYGLMELVGTFLERTIRILYKVPGRSSIDALASWMGSAPVGVMITTQQYEKGFYTKREAAIIATNFSVLSIPFSIVIARFIQIEEYFFYFYATMAIASLITALIMVRIWPLNRKEDTYYETSGKQIDDRVVGDNLYDTAKKRAYLRASKAAPAKLQIKEGFINGLDIYGSLIPIVIAIGTLALIIANYTPIFNWISLPIGFILSIIQIPEAYSAAPAFIIGITDMFLPSVLAQSIESEFTRFIVASLSLTQIIYFSEVGALLLKSKIPVSVLELVLIFILRSIISFPIIYILALIFVGV